MPELTLTKTWTVLSQKREANHGRVMEMLLPNLS